MITNQAVRGSDPTVLRLPVRRLLAVGERASVGYPVYEIKHLLSLTGLGADQILDDLLIGQLG